MQKKFFLGILFLSSINIFSSDSLRADQHSRSFRSASTHNRLDNFNSPIDPFTDSIHSTNDDPFLLRSYSPSPTNPGGSPLRPLEILALYGENTPTSMPNLSLPTVAVSKRDVYDDFMPKSDETHRDPRFPTRSTTPIYTAEDLDNINNQFMECFKERQRLFSNCLQAHKNIFLESIKNIPGKRKTKNINANILVKKLTGKDLQMLNIEELKNLDYNLSTMQQMNINLFDQNYRILQYIISSKLKKLSKS